MTKKREKLFGGDSAYQSVLAILIALFVCFSAVAGAGSAMTQQSGASVPSAATQANSNSNTAPATPNVSADYTTSNGSTATVSSASLPDGGYVAVYRYLDSTNSLQLIGVSDHISAGAHTNVTVGLFDVPHRKFSADKLNSTTYLVTRLHTDSNDNKQFDYPTSPDSKDQPYTNGSDQPVSSSDYLDVTSAGSEDEEARSEASSDQSTRESASSSNAESDGDTTSSANSRSSFKVKSKGKERTYYTLSVSGEVEPGSGFDTTNAAVPDTQTANEINGSVAANGVDNLSYSGEISTLYLSNENAEVYIDGKEVEPSDYPDRPAQSTTEESTDSPATSSSASTPTSESDSTSDESESDTAQSAGGDESTTPQSENESESDTESDTSGTTELTQNAEAQINQQGQSGEAGAVTFEEQTTDGKSVVVDSATLPADGFVVLHGPSYSSVGMLEESVIAVSDPLSEGAQENITLQPGQNVPADRYNQSKLSGSGNYTAILYQDTNSNGEFDYLQNSGQDIPFTAGSGENERLLSDTTDVTVEGTRGDPNLTEERAKISFSEQSSSGTSVTVDSVSLPDGGFVSIHNESYLPPNNDSLGSTIGVSRYLDSGNHTNVEVQLYDVPGKNYSQSQLSSSQTLTAVASQDVNANGSYDYITSSGQFDVAYLSESGSVVDSQAEISISDSDSDSAFTTSADQESTDSNEDDGSGSETTGTFGNETIQQPDADSDESGNESVPSNESVEIEGRQVQTPTQSANESEQQSGGIVDTVFSGLTIIVLLVLIVGAGVTYVVIRKK